MIDLSALDVGQTETVVEGTPKQIFLYDIVEDPDQPRTEFPEDEMEKLTESVRQRGVKSPISVKPHPSEAGKWLINHGHRRYRASLMAGKETIPAFVDEDHDDYDQVMENKERLGHTPIEIAKFIQKKIAQGEKKGVIAKKLNEDPVYISTHLALIEMPECIEKAYEAGFKSPKTLYDLRKLYESYPEQVESFVNDSLKLELEISRSRVQALSKELKKPKVESNPVEVEPSEEFQLSEVQDQPETTTENNEHVKTEELQVEDNEDQLVIELADETNFKEPKEPKEEDPNKIKKPLVCVNFEGRQAFLILNKKPTSLGFAWIKFEDGTEQEVDCNQLELEYLKEGA
ncbi:ParB/RepB/Spo0J family partition protein [Acinetobacter baumannii]|nr:ParB/RepB/Spo0J family partition protein [Acinetobacter baumannii]